MIFRIFERLFKNNIVPLHSLKKQNYGNKTLFIVSAGDNALQMG